jgi:hypothetical protein
VLRAGLAAAAAVLTAVAAHRVAHGTVDGVGAAWAFAGLVAPAWWLTGRELGWARLALVQLGGQQVAHLALAATAGAGGLLPLDLMFHAHLAAAALTACWLRMGERRAWAALRRAALVVLNRPPTLRPTARPSRPVPPDPGPSRVVEGLRYALARRGPPLPA